MSEPLEIPLILERLEGLERQNRRLKQTLAVAFVLLGSLFFMGAGKIAKFLEARRTVRSVAIVASYMASATYAYTRCGYGVVAVFANSRLEIRSIHRYAGAPASQNSICWLAAAPFLTLAIPSIRSLTADRDEPVEARVADEVEAVAVGDDR